MRAASLFLCYALLLAPLPACATDYYLRSSGSDTHRGTSPDEAWQTLRRASSAQFQPGDRLLLEGGASFAGTLELDSQDSGTAERPVTITTFGSAKAQILAGDGFGIIARNVQGIVIENLSIAGSGAATNNGAGVAVVNSLASGEKLNFVRIRHVDASGFGRNASGSDSISLAGCGIFVGGDRGESGYRDVVIEDSTAFDNEYFGILVGGANYPPKDPSNYANEDVTIRRCQAYDNPGDPTFLENHSGNGILLTNTDGGVIEHSQAWNNGGRCYSEKGGPVGIWAWASNRITIQYCESHHNKSPRKDGGGFDFDGGVSNSVMQYNYSHDNDGTGYLLYTHPGSPYRFENNIVRHCVSRDDGRFSHRAAIWIRNDDTGIRNLEVHDNTFIYTPVGDDAGVAFVANTENVRFHHNILITTGDVPLIRQEKNKGLSFEDNLYSAGRGGFRVHWDGKEYTDPQTWRRETAQEENTLLPEEIRH